MRKRFWFAGGLAVAVLGLFVINSSELAPKPSGQRTILAHRGVYQQYDRTGLTRDTCTASRMLPPRHAFLENTLPSMKAGFEAGADIIEIDVHPTTDGQFAVFHDWTVDCRTDGHGVTREHTLVELQALDIGHGYTADGGKTYPFRGKFKGQMPSLKQALDAFPDKRFLINIKSNDPTEADKLVAHLQANSLMSPRLSAYGGDRPVARLREIAPGMRAFSKKTLKSCALGYLMLGWSEHMPKACRNTTVFLPRKFAWLAWGYPNRLQQRFHNAGSDIYLLGNNKSTNGVEGIDTVEALESVPDNWRMGILTDEIETIGPALKQK
jgi:glycerophosphoryl diester phosphodiesterase